MRRGHVLTSTLFVLASTLFVCIPVAAQEPIAVVRAVRAEVIAAGINVDAHDECARFEVTKRVAARLAHLNAGLLYKPHGNNCEQRSVDIVAFPDGRIFDVLGAGPDGPNTPLWMALTPVDPARWRAPFAIDAPAPAPLPATPIPAPAPSDLYSARIDRALEELAAVRAELAALRAQNDELHAQTRQEIKNFRESAKRATGKVLEILPTIIGGLGLLR
jgi:hypothetical protein